MDIFEAARACSIVGEYERTGNKLKGKNGVLRGVCPICGGSNPTEFIVFESANNFFCHRCGAKGDVITFKSVIEGTDLQTTAENLCKENGIPIDDKTTKFSHQRKQTKRKQDEELTAALSGAADAFEEKAKLAIEKPVGDKLTENAEMARAAASYEFNEVDPNSSIEFKVHALYIVGEKETADDICAKYGDVTPGSAAAKPELDLPDETKLTGRKPETPVFMIYPYIRRGKITAVSSRGGIGKGHFVLLLAALASKGCDFSQYDDITLYGGQRCEKRHVTEPTHTLYITRGEDDTDEINSRYLNSGGVEGFLHLINEDTEYSDGRKFPIFNFKIDTPDGERMLGGLVQKYNAKIIVFDTMDKFVMADSNRQGEVQTALLNLQTFAQKYGVVVIAILHDRKGGSGGNMADRVAGSREWTDVPRSVLQLDFDPEDEKAEANRKATKRRVAVHTKCNDGCARTLRFIISGKPGCSQAHFPYSDDECGAFAEVSADDYELADMRKTTVRAILAERRSKQKIQQAKSDALKASILKEVAEMHEKGETRVKYSYQQFEAKHGKSVWGGEAQRQKALKEVSPELSLEGIRFELEKVRGSDGRYGFTICIDE